MIDYNKRLVEVDEILKYLSNEDLVKIPEDVRQAIKDNKDKEYIWKYDISKELKDQGLCKDTIILLSYLNMEYLLNQEQKQFMKELHAFNEKKLEEEKSKLYNPNDIFKNKKTEETSKEETSLITYKESLFTKIINKIKCFFGIYR